MAKLLGSHPLDCCRACPSCGKLCEARYEGAQLVDDGHGGIAEGRIYTCSACSSTYVADIEPRPNATEDELLKVTDKREWARLRVARMRGATLLGIAVPAAVSAPGPGTRGAVALGAGFYSFAGEPV